MDIPSDGQFHSIPVFSEDVKARVSFVTVPRETQDVFRFVQMSNPLKAPLLEGPVDIHVGDGFLMTAPLRQVAPWGKIKLGLGVEQGIKVARNASYEEETSGLMSGSLRLRHAIRIEVVHHLRETVQLEVRERIPVADDGDEQVEIATFDVDPEWQTFQQGCRPIRGGYRWKLALEPGTEQTLRASYVVQIPSKHEIVGGNRREG